jgi:hypothetical protein
MSSATMDVGICFVTGFITHLQLIIIIRCGAIASLHIQQFTAVSNESPRSTVSSLVLCYRIPTADVLLPLSSENVPVPQPQQLLTQSESYFLLGYGSKNLLFNIHYKIRSFMKFAHFFIRPESPNRARVNFNIRFYAISEVPC